MARTFDINYNKIDEYNIFNPQDMKNFLLVLLMFASGFAIAAVVFGFNLIPLDFLDRTVSPSDTDLQTTTFEPDIVAVPSNAFGKLALSAGSDARTQAGGTEVGLGGGGGLVSAPLATPIAADSIAVDSKMIIGPDFEVYQYIYDGDITLPEGDMVDVYKRKLGGIPQSGLANFAEGFGLGLVNISAFTGLRTEYVNFVQSGNMGYLISINPDLEHISIQKNYDQWPNPLNDCWRSDMDVAAAENCVQRNSLKASDVPADEELIKIADNFLNKYGINKANYGEPYVGHNQQVYYILASDGGRAEPEYIPEEIQVIYPVLVDGNKVSDGYANYVGLNVSVDIRNKQVGNVYGLNSQKYEKSEYEKENDTAKLKDYLKSGGLYRNYFYPEGVNIKEIKVGEPELQMVKYMNWADNKTVELIVPALIFPVERDPNNPYGTQQVIVPIVKELIENSDAMAPYPMPLLERAVTSTDLGINTAAPVSTAGPAVPVTVEPAPAVEPLDAPVERK